MSKSLDNYLKQLEVKGLLKKEEIGFDQVRALLAGASRNIAASDKNIEIDEEACYTLAYNAMMKTGRALVFLYGYRPSDGQQHKTTVDVAGEILGNTFKSLIAMFDAMRKKRNQFTYDPMLPLSLTEATTALKTARDFHKKVKIFLDEHYPQLRLFE